MSTRYVIQRLSDDTVWYGGKRWGICVSMARGFPSKAAAEKAAVRDLPDPTPAYRVLPVDLELFA